MTSEQPLLDLVLACGRERRPLIGAHRGASARAPENTLAAFRAALEDGAELIEIDVHLTLDARLVVIHDETTERTTGVRGTIARMSMAQLRRLDAGRRADVQWAGERLPELGEVLALARGRLLVNVEVKGGVGGVAAIPALAACVAEYDMGAHVVVSSFDPAVVRAAAAARAGWLAGLLCDRRPADPVGAAREVGAALLHVKHTLVDAPLVEATHRAGLGVLAWTVNQAAEMRRLHALGVDALLSDDPALLCATVSTPPDRAITEKPNNPATQQPNHPVTQLPSDPATKQSSNRGDA